VSPMYVAHPAEIRENVRRFLAASAREHGSRGRLLGVAPQGHEGAAPFVEPEIDTLESTPPRARRTSPISAGPTTSSSPTDRFDVVVCTEVLEHVLAPFSAVREKRCASRGLRRPDATSCRSSLRPSPAADAGRRAAALDGPLRRRPARRER
jgi:hypothetical protein